MVAALFEASVTDNIKPMSLKIAENLSVFLTRLISEAPNPMITTE